jgi:pyridoxine kinase
LQRLGFDVITLNTVQFSNHTGYGAWTGEIFTKDHLLSLLDGLEQRGVLQRCTALLTGYLGSPDTAFVVMEAYRRISSYNDDRLYVCDPVMGDVGRGLFVHQEIPRLFKENIAPVAQCLTPNLFELEVLTQRKIDTYDHLKRALLSLSNPLVIVTSVDLPDINPDKDTSPLIHMVMKYGHDFHTVSAPRLSFDTPPNGAGDAVSAFFLGYYLQTKDYRRAFERTNISMQHLFKMTKDSSTREIALIQAQHHF